MTIRLNNIQLYAYHGAYEHERELGSNFEFDIAFEADLDKAANSDDLNDTIDYAKVYEQIRAIATEKKYTLIEALASSSPGK